MRRPAVARGGRRAAALVLLLAAGPAPGQEPVSIPVPGYPRVGVLPGLPPLKPPDDPADPVPVAADPAPPAAGSGGGGGATGSAAGAGGLPTLSGDRGPVAVATADKNLTIVLGGRAQLDLSDYITTSTLRRNLPGVNPLDPGVSFRRLRLDAGGTIYKHTDYLLQVDFVNGLGLGAIPNGPRFTDIVVPTDAWVTFKDLPVVGNIRVGNQKPNYSFEHLTSSRFLNFLERSLGFDAFVENFDNGFEPGVSVYDTYLDKRGTWAVGWFKNTRNPFGFNVGRNEQDLNARLTALPVWGEDGKYLVHLGLGASRRDADDGLVRFRARFDARNSPSGLAPLVVDTGLFPAARQHLVVPELVAVCGPLSVQSEFYGSWVNDARPAAANGRGPAGTVYSYSYYAEAHLFLTGEHRAYNRNTAVFDRVKPVRPVEWTRAGFTGCGAWQLTARYTYLDLNNKGITGGRVNDMTLGVNWFLNPYSKVQWNYFLADRDVANPAGDGLVHGFATRLAWDF